MRLWHLFLAGALAGLGFYAAPATAVVAPKLSRMMVRINGADREFLSHQKIELVRGDELTLLHGVLDGTARSPEILNFVGFLGRGPRRWKDDDRDIVIQTSNLDKGWSFDKSGKLYKIEARTGEKFHGDILVSILNPELKFLRLEIKGVEYQLGPGDIQEMGAEDLIKVVDLKTNSSALDGLVRVEFKTAGKTKEKLIELRIFYRSYAFASVFLKPISKNPP
jgi:hypothetical protein